MDGRSRTVCGKAVPSRSWRSSCRAVGVSGPTRLRSSRWSSRRSSAVTTGGLPVPARCVASTATGALPRRRTPNASASRWLVRPLHVVEGDDDRPALGQRPQYAQSRSCDRALVRPIVVRACEQEGDGKRPSLRIGQVFSDLVHDAPQQVTERRERELRLVVRGSGDEHAKSPCARILDAMPPRIVFPIQPRPRAQASATHRGRQRRGRPRSRPTRARGRARTATAAAAVRCHRRPQDRLSMDRPEFCGPRAVL